MLTAAGNDYIMNAYRYHKCMHVTSQRLMDNIIYILLETAPSYCGDDHTMLRQGIPLPPADTNVPVPVPGVSERGGEYIQYRPLPGGRGCW